MGANVKCVLTPSPNGLSQGLGWPVYAPYVVLGPMHSNATRTSTKYLRGHNTAAVTSVPSFEALYGELTSRSALQIPCLKDRSYTVPVVPEHEAFLVIQCEKACFYIDHVALRAYRVFPLGEIDGKCMC